jgi:pimeloyl-ACP methyl ester carboxylesterase
MGFTIPRKVRRPTESSPSSSGGSGRGAEAELEPLAVLGGTMGDATVTDSPLAGAATGRDAQAPRRTSEKAVAGANLKAHRAYTRSTAATRTRTPRAMSAAGAGASYVEANGIRFAYFEEGKGPLVLMVHGFPDTAHTWDVVRPGIAAAGYRVVTPFTRGYAPTQIPPDGPFDSETLGSDLVALICALGESKAIVVGHDWGASGAYAAATLEPEKVEMLVTLAIPHPASLKPSVGLLWKARHFLSLNLPGAAKRMRANDFAYVDELVRRWSPAWNVPPGETDAVKAAFREPGCVEAAVAYYKHVGKPPPSLRKKISVPTVAFAGLEDIVPPEAFDAAASRYTASYRVVRMPGGHFLHREYPERFEKELIEALDKRG